MACSCEHDLEKIQIIKDYAEGMASQLIDDLGTICPCMLDMLIEQVVARMVHIGIILGDNLHGVDPTFVEHDRKTLDLVSSKLNEMSNTTPAVLQVILNEQRALGGKSACH